MLVKIISFLETRDRVKLRYVSQKLRSISETPSLWRDFVWLDCNSCEERCLHNVMKSCGAHFRQLSFPQRLTQQVYLQIAWQQQASLRLVNTSEMAKMLRYCSNLTHLSLPELSSPSDDSDLQLREAIQEMKHLQVFKIHCCGSFQQYLNLNIALKELTIHREKISGEDIEASKNWMINGFTPPKLNVVILRDDYLSYLTVSRFLVGLYKCYGWPVGHTACLKVYFGYFKVPLNLFKSAPTLQLQYGGESTLPFVQVSSVGIDREWLLLLTDHDDGSKMVYKATLDRKSIHSVQGIIHHPGQQKLDDEVFNLTELDLDGHDFDFKGIVAVCPWLQRLNLSGYASLKLEDLQVIATFCSNLQGLNLMEISICDVNFCLQAWEILSGMKLTHLSANTWFVGELTEMDDVQEKQLAALFKRCITLQALELVNENHSCKLLSHFPSLRYCKFINIGQSISMQDILTTCKGLQYFYFCYGGNLVKLPPLSVQTNLQQLCVLSETIHLDDSFMKMVSAHGGLVHVVFTVGSVTSQGVSTLINNSPNLLSFILCETTLNKSLNASLRKKFSHRKLFTSGVFVHVKDYGDPECMWLGHTDLLTLWPQPPENIFRRSPKSK